MKPKKQTSMINMGISYLLVVFIILCLVTFAILSISSAYNDYGYSLKIAQRTQDYYEADAQAQQTLASIDALLDAVCQEGINPLSYVSEVEQRVSEFPKGVSLEGTVLSYETPLNDTHTLSVSLQLHYPVQAEEGYYTISRWQVISANNWTGDDTLHLMENYELD